MPAAAFTDPAWLPPTHSPPLISLLAGSGELIDVAVIGGGLLGLTTAFHSARRGRSVQVLEAGELGGGASGINGGQVIPGFKYGPGELVQRFGAVTGEKIVAFGSSLGDAVFDLIAREDLAVPHARAGWISAAHTETSLRADEVLVREWRERGSDVAMLSEAEVAGLTGARGYLGGWIDKRAGIIDPLAFTLELARIAAAAGARIVTNRKVVRLRREGGLWLLSLAGGGLVRARAVVAATNAYTDGLVPGLAQTLVPLHSFQVATAKLAPDVADAILPGGQAVSDSRRIVTYYRKSPDGRFVLGGRGRMALPTRVGDWAHLEHAMRRLYPALAGVAIEKRWFGRVAMTPDHMPHIHEPEHGLIAVVGCQGRGVGLMTALGPAIAAYLAERDPAALPLPLSPIRPIPFHAFRQIGVAAAIAWYRTLDVLER